MTPTKQNTEALSYPSTRIVKYQWPWAKQKSKAIPKHPTHFLPGHQGHREQRDSRSKSLRHCRLGLRLRELLLLMLRLRELFQMRLGRRERGGKGCRCSYQLRRCILRIDGTPIRIHIGLPAVRVLSDRLDGLSLLLAQDNQVKASRKDGVRPVTLYVSPCPGGRGKGRKGFMQTHFKKSCFKSRALSRSAC
jgi:hypothetical protein